MHNGEIVKVSYAGVIGGYFRLRLTTVSPHADTRSIVCAGRGLAMAIQARLADRAAAREALPEPAVAVAQ